MQYCKINNDIYPVIAIYGRVMDPDWDDRESKRIHLPMTYELAKTLFVDGCHWSIIDVFEPEDPNEESQTFEFDNAEFSMAGDITDHRDGTISVKMGKETDLEAAYELLYGGDQ